MLEFIRQHSKSVIVKVLLGALAATFIFCFGMFDVINKLMGKDFVIKVGNIKISPIAFRIEKDRRNADLRNQINLQKMHEKQSDPKKTAPNDPSQYKEIDTQTIVEDMVYEIVNDLACQEFGFVVSEQSIKNYISLMPMFRDKNNRFDAGLLRRLLSHIQMHENQFVENCSKNIKSSLIKFPLKFVSVKFELDSYMKSCNERRSLHVVELNRQDFRIEHAFTKDELVEFYDSHHDLFMEEEKRDFTLLSFKEKDVKKDISVSNEEIEDHFKEIAAENEDKTLDDMRKEIHDKLLEEKLESAINEKTRSIEDELVSAGDKTVNEAVKKFGLSARHFKGISKDDTKAIDLPYNKDVLAIAFSLDQGTCGSFSESLDKGEKCVWGIFLDNVRPKHVNQYEKIAKDVERELIKHKQKLAMLACAQDVKSKKTDLSAFARKSNKKIGSTPFFDINATCEKEDHAYKELVKKIAEQIFGLDKSDVLSVEIGDKVFLVQVSCSKFIDSNKQEDGKMHGNLINEYSEELYQQLMNFKANAYGKSVNQSRLKEIDDSSPKQPDFNDIF